MIESLPYRQIHLDFHCSPDIKNIGVEFDSKKFQQTLMAAEVNSITLFATCHHGWSYYDTAIGKRHPHLNFDLLKAQFEACKAVGIRVQIYLTAGVNNQIWEAHPEWREIRADGTYPRIKDINSPGFRKLCLNSQYIDMLCQQIIEVATIFPDCDGIFMDIIKQEACCCKKCSSDMKKQDIDINDETANLKFGQKVLDNYYRKTFNALRSVSPNMGIFHNAGHITRGKRNIIKYLTHLELESLPTGGWGYDHFPLSAKYAQHLGLEYLGMTGKFHTTWGEMGGFKHPNALRYECAAMLAHGARCSIGDHPPPGCNLDSMTYSNIGQAYHEVKNKEPWCMGAKQVVDIALLSAESFGFGQIGRDNVPDTGAARFLLEEHFLFDVIDREVDLNKYKLVILPDCIPIDSDLYVKLDDYLQQGGKLFLTGDSGKDINDKFIFNIGAQYSGLSEFELDYILPDKEFCPDFIASPLVMYRRSNRIKVTDGISLGKVFEPFFNRTGEHFSGHQHAPPKPEASGFDCGVRKNNIFYLAHPVFSIYYQLGAVAYRQYIAKTLRFLLAEDETVISNLSSTARLTLTQQDKQCRYILHLLYGNTIKRGANMSMEGGTVSHNTEIEIIEELLPLHNIKIKLKLSRTIKKVTLEPQGQEISFTINDGYYNIKIDSFVCHQMIVFHF